MDDRPQTPPNASVNVELHLSFFPGKTSQALSMELIKTIVMGAGLLLMWNGYQEGKDPTPPTPAPSPLPAPDPSPGPNPSPVPGPIVPGTTLKIVVDPPEQLAPVPNPSYLSSAAPLYAALKGHPEDALKLARAYAAWANLIATDGTLRTTQEFQQAYTSAMQVLLAKHAIAGKYSHKLTNDPIVAVFTAAGLADGTTVKAEAWTPVAGNAAKEAFNLISHECFRAYADSVVTPK